MKRKFFYNYSLFTHALLKTLPYNKTSPPTFAMIWFPIKHRDEKGNPVYLPAEGTESGAIPVAVKGLT